MYLQYSATEPINNPKLFSLDIRQMNRQTDRQAAV